MIGQIRPGCLCSTYLEDDGRYECSVTGDYCMFMIPDAVSCAKRFGEGPLASVLASDEGLQIEQLQEEILDMDAEIDHLKALVLDWTIDNEVKRLQAENKCLTAERDAAIYDIATLMKEHPLCELCKMQGTGKCEYSSHPPYSCVNNEWRGAPEATP